MYIDTSQQDWIKLCAVDVMGDKNVKGRTMTKGAKKSVRSWISALVSRRSSITIMGDSMLSLRPHTGRVRQC